MRRASCGRHFGLFYLVLGWFWLAFGRFRAPKRRRHPSRPLAEVSRPRLVLTASVWASLPHSFESRLRGRGARQFHLVVACPSTRLVRSRERPRHHGCVDVLGFRRDEISQVLPMKIALHASEMARERRRGAEFISSRHFAIDSQHLAVKQMPRSAVSMLSESNLRLLRPLGTRTISCHLLVLGSCGSSLQAPKSMGAKH